MHGGFLFRIIIVLTIGFALALLFIDGAITRKKLGEVEAELAYIRKVMQVNTAYVAEYRDFPFIASQRLASIEEVLREELRQRTRPATAGATVSGAPTATASARPE